MTTLRENLALSAIASLGLAGCATTPVVFNYSIPVVNVREPALKSVRVAQRGENILRQGIYRELDVVLVENDVKLGMFDELTIGRGYYRKVGQDKHSSFYLPDSGRLSSTPVRRPKAPLPTGVLQAYDAEPTLCLLSADHAVWGHCVHHANFKRLRQIAGSMLEQRLIYSGRLGNEIKIDYRESAEDTPRPAASKALEFDLNGSRVFSYRGARVEVLEVTNEYLQYRVLRDFDSPTQ